MKLSEIPLPKGKPLEERVRSEVFDRCTVPWCTREHTDESAYCEVCEPGTVPPPSREIGQESDESPNEPENQDRE